MFYKRTLVSLSYAKMVPTTLPTLSSSLTLNVYLVELNSGVCKFLATATVNVSVLVLGIGPPSVAVTWSWKNKKNVIHQLHALNNSCFHAKKQANDFIRQ